MISAAGFSHYVIVLLSIGCIAQSARAACLKYEPAVVSLRGTLVRRTYPGPPNYEDVRAGDRPETFWLLKLDSTFCVEQNKVEPDLDPKHEKINLVELVVSAEMYRSQKSLVGKRVLATGTLFGAITGHHHTPVLLAAKRLELVPRKP